MNTKDIKILFTDIDGTLFSHVTHQVPSSAIAAIKELQNKGIKVFLCSGRNYYLVRKTGILDIVHPDGIVMMNGACAQIGEKIIYQHPIPEEVVNAMIKFSYRLKFGLTLIEESEGHINIVDDRVIDAHAKYGTRFPQPRKFPIPYDRVIYQMIAFCDEFDESLFLPHLKDCKTARWDEYAVDIMPTDSDKSRGIMAVLKYYGLKPENALCIGDGFNDVEMMQYAGVSVAMGNAKDEVKKHADYVTEDIDEDGWAEAMMHLGLID
ncbi:MAG: Cof-type HAD-IIB family hydrolase [Bacilli bacterium]|nr:Cof-type HAD-IIB family hydrolase [Bacilli bacterium]